MNLDPLVSIITPMYNAENTICQTIDSVLNQTYNNWELIIVDDASTDKSESIVQNYIKFDKRIKYFKINNNVGSPYFARNLATNLSKGEIIAFLDSDDVWLEKKLEKQVGFMMQNNYEIVFSFYEKMSSNGERSNRIIKAPYQVDYRTILMYNPIGCLTAIYNKNVVGKLYQIDHKHEDYIMWIKVLEKKFVAHCYPEVLALYRLSNNSVSSSKLKMAMITWNIYRNVFKFNFIKSIMSILSYSFYSYKKYLK